MRQIALKVSYDGTRYAGFQVQKNGPTIQGVLESALRKILKEKIRLTSSGRTDAGVHALAHITAFKTAASLSPDALKKALNSQLPLDIVVLLVLFKIGAHCFSSIGIFPERFRSAFCSKS